uniref:Uncharacterized protein n=1 Tax=Anguilla anguilla TaxID=7936 RepID=A0A0E9VBT8_ANGAN
MINAVNACTQQSFRLKTSHWSLGSQKVQGLAILQAGLC